MQRAVLPDRLPEVPGVELAATYMPNGGPEAGDWYEVFELDENRVGIAMCDVAGRGRAAGALGARLRRGLKRYAAQGWPPGDVLGGLNQLMAGDCREMATLLYVVYDRETHELRAANAGHPPAVVRGTAGETRYWDAGRGVPLGIARDATYREERIVLEPQGALLLFTDGLIERRGMPLDDALAFVEGLVIARASAGEIRTAVLDAMVAGEDHDDDVAVLALTVGA